ncbi:MAG: hypothetical protein GXP08_08925 [Gammaproteobacteria bacterium]|nr:hypothetical protein [Gammaproteobacteria bacterium]
MFKKWAAVLGVVIMLVLSGCSPLTSLIPQKVPDKVVVAKYKDIPIDKIFSDTQKLFNKARDEVLPLFSPNNYRTARSAMKRARVNMRDPEKKTDVLQSLYKVENALNNGFQTKIIVEREMPELIEMRIILEELNAKRLFPMEYRGRVSNMTMLIERIEQHKESLFDDSEKKADFVKDKNNMLVDLRKFHLRIVKSKYLSRGEAVFAEAEQYGAKDNAPKTYSETIQARDDALAYIEKNLRHTEGVKLAADTFEFAAFRLLHITRAVGDILQIEKNQHENYVLKKEKGFTKISKALKLGDIRNKSQNAQMILLATTAAKVIKQKEDFALKIAELSSAQIAVESNAENEAPASGVAQGSSDIINEATLIQQQQPPQKKNPQQPIAATIEEQQSRQKNEDLLKKQVETLTVKNKALTAQRIALEKQLSGLQAKLNALPYIQKNTSKPPQVQQP